jgi:hypothetical protein
VITERRIQGSALSRVEPEYSSRIRFPLLAIAGELQLEGAPAGLK